MPNAFNLHSHAMQAANRFGRRGRRRRLRPAEAGSGSTRLRGMKCGKYDLRRVRSYNPDNPNEYLLKTAPYVPTP